MTFGVSWPRGALTAEAATHLQCADGRALPTQTWPLAWWPDGSVKWSGVAVVAGNGDGDAFRLVPGAGPEPARKVSVKTKLVP